MEFKSLKNIETEFRQIRLFTLVFLALCAAVPLCAVWMSFRYAEAQREKIYVLDQGKPDAGPFAGSPAKPARRSP